MHSCGRVRTGVLSQEGKLIRFVGVCWREEMRGMLATETHAHTAQQQ